MRGLKAAVILSLFLFILAFQCGAAAEPDRYFEKAKIILLG